MTQPRPNQMVTRKQFAVVVILIVITGFATNYAQFRQAAHIKAKSHSRDVEDNHLRAGICFFADRFAPPDAPDQHAIAELNCPRMRGKP